MISVKAVVYYQGKFLLLKPTDDKNAINGWDGPGGKVEEGETLEDALRREVREETGISIERLLPLTSLKLPNTEIDYLIFLCTSLSDKVTLSSEHTDYKWVTIEEFSEFTKFDLKTLIIQTISSLKQVIS